MLVRATYFSGDVSVKPGHHLARLAKPPIVSASLASQSPLKGIKNPGSKTAAQKQGKRYEAKILKKTDLFTSVTSLKSPWLQYIDAQGLRFCQPDLLLFYKDIIVLCEIKLSHTANAYFQLEGLYRPVVERLFPGYTVLSLEITRSFDPGIRFPEEFFLYFSMEDFLIDLTTSLSMSRLNVLQWKL